MSRTGSVLLRHDEQGIRSQCGGPYVQRAERSRVVETQQAPGRYDLGAYRSAAIGVGKICPAIDNDGHRSTVTEATALCAIGASLAMSWRVALEPRDL